MGNIYQQHRPGGDNDLYLKLKDGDRVKLRIASEPAISVYQEGAKPRYSWIVFNRELGKPQVYTSGVSVYSQIADLSEEWGSPDTFDIVIKRTGSGLQDTSYSVTPIKTSPDLTKEQLEEVEKVNLLQAIKGKWLADYVDDGELPDPVTNAPAEPEIIGLPSNVTSSTTSSSHKPDPVVTDKEMGEPINLSDEDMPPDFLK